MKSVKASKQSHKGLSCSEWCEWNMNSLMNLISAPLFLILFVTPAFAQDADFGSTERTKPFKGTWGVRILLPTSQDPRALDSFDVSAFIEQVTQLHSISYVMINIHNGHFGSYHNSPHPELQAVLGTKHFPDRDLFGEVVDALVEKDLKDLVYFSSPGFDWAEKYVPNRAIKPLWESHIRSKSMSHWDAVATLIVKHYSEKYGEKISLRMVTTIENGPFIKGPFINDKDRPTPEPDEGTLGQIFMPL